MAHRNLALVDPDEDYSLRELPMPDDRDSWPPHPGQHSNTDDGRLLARIDERTSNIVRQIDDVHRTAHALFDTLEKDLGALTVRVDVLEKNWIRAIAYLTVGGVIMTMLSPLIQAMLRASLHLP